MPLTTLAILAVLSTAPTPSAGPEAAIGFHDEMPKIVGMSSTPIADAVARVAASPVTQPQPPSSRVDVALGIASLTASGVAMGLTAACVTARTCKEVNPLMRRWVGKSIPGAIVAKAVINGGLVYLVYRFIPKGGKRTLALALLAVGNLFDAVHDWRVTKQIEGRR